MQRNAVQANLFRAVLLLLVGSGPISFAQMGHVLEAVGPVNQSMAGAGTALPLDAMGALHWNPGSISGLSSSEMSFSFTAFAPVTSLQSQVAANAFGPGAPPATLSGSTTSDTDISPIPAMAIVHRPSASRWTFGLGGYGIGGFGVNFPTDPNNPILTPQPPLGGMGFGAIFSRFQLMQFSPTASYQLTPCWSIGFAPTVNWATLSITPFSAAAPNLDGTYPNGAIGDDSWGMGFQVGTYYQAANSPWNLGLSYKSTQWFQTYRINSMDSNGAYRQLAINLDYPSILSLGVAYRGFNRVRIASDVRYIDYKNTDGFQAAGFDANGAVTGFGWKSIWASSTGLEYAISNRMFWRWGYTFNESPISSQQMFYNSPAPGIVQHHLSTGFTRFCDSGWNISMAYQHGFENTVSGRWWHPSLGAVSGTSVAGTLATHALVAGISRKF
ncbi:MAG: outer membrane protein transport protein [Planctomycetales bacterium]|nr:outer membrane protein transport protein [Planctomycetales bacterium]